jgi:LuxR family maltose regulon positive regulatory protein
VLARLLITRDAPERALPLLERIYARAADEGRASSVIEARALQALALEAAGESERALDAIRDALSLARSEGYVRVFADEGEPMAALLRRLIASARRGVIPPVNGALLDYAGRLLGAIAAELRASGKAASPTARTTELVEPLTEREREVLLLLAEGKSNREIADQLVVSLDTVKKHLTHVFGKLGAASRTQAITRARGLGLLP